MFGVDEKNQKSKNYKRIRSYLILRNKDESIDESPSLIKCEGCERNISKKKIKESEIGECLIYLANEESRIIKKRFEDESDIYFGINTNILKLLNEFMKNLSNRRKLDEEMYIDLMFMENFLKKTKMNIASCNSKILTELDDLRRNLRKELNEEKDRKLKEYSVEFINEALTINEFNLYWKKNLIPGG
ncbi:hypothetical protein RhiirA4_430530 [Rhizophagus irregularis]|uniref:Uncharacterized protein n=1 Tax=Rhizophagus irregularis TaxID=588596 RepID=A0A2I1HL42_9GLOM|nr:hypothetical protein RhiirA4_430530 [Rhizophagus irregularis]